MHVLLSHTTWQLEIDNFASAPKSRFSPAKMYVFGHVCICPICYHTSRASHPLLTITLLCSTIYDCIHGCLLSQSDILFGSLWLGASVFSLTPLASLRHRYCKTALMPSSLSPTRSSSAVIPTGPPRTEKLQKLQLHSHAFISQRVFNRTASFISQGHQNFKTLHEVTQARESSRALISQVLGRRKMTVAEKHSLATSSDPGIYAWRGAIVTVFET